MGVVACSSGRSKSATLISSRVIGWLNIRAICGLNTSGYVLMIESTSPESGLGDERTWRVKSAFFRLKYDSAIRGDCIGELVFVER